jgi:citrate lyase subunit beta/citryl-CoA lyase
MPLTSPRPPRIRSALFVPAQRTEFLAKIDRRGADAVILDLEDAVAESGKAAARTNASGWLETRTRGDRPWAMARVNTGCREDLERDLAAVVHDALLGVLVPKIQHPDDVRLVADLLSWHEGRRGLPRGQIHIWPIIETASAVRRVDEIAAASNRVEFMGGGTSQDGDLARSVGFEWTPEGLETLVIRSQVLVAARAAGVRNPMTGLVSSLADPEGVRRFALASRQLGYAGMMVIHPAHVSVVNEVFTPTNERVEDARQVVRALNHAADTGNGAVEHDGRMIDSAMAHTARQFLSDAGLPAEEPDLS